MIEEKFYSLSLWFYSICLNGKSFISSFGEWWRFITTGEYDGDKPYGQQVFFTYLGRTMKEAHRVLQDTYNDYGEHCLGGYQND